MRIVAGSTTLSAGDNLLVACFKIGRFDIMTTSTKFLAPTLRNDIALVSKMRVMTNDALAIHCRLVPSTGFPVDIDRVTIETELG